MNTTETKPENPPAFARAGTQPGTHQNGMTLRDFFAAIAMAAESIADSIIVAAMDEGRRDSDQTTAKNAYELADAMLKERTK